MNQKKPNNDAAKIVAEVLGFISREAKDTIIKDISFMLEKELSKELDGYVYALTRIVEKTLMKECIIEAFAKCNMPIPDKYEKKVN